MPGALQRKESRTLQILLLATGISFAISWLSISNAFVLSPDSLLYIFTAQTFLDNGLKAATDVYPWPFLSILIAGIHKATGLSLANSGHALISILYAALSCTFVLLVKDLGGTTRTQLLALLVISILPTINDYRDYITRDAGFWLFTLLSVMQLLRYALTSNLKHGFGWLLFTLLASLFRTEAIFFLLFAPLALLTDTHINLKQRLIKTASLYGFLALILLSGIIILTLSPEFSTKFRLVSEIVSLPDFFNTLVQKYQQTIRSFSDIAPHKFAANDMGAIIGTGLIGLVVYSTVHALTPTYLVLLTWPRKGPLYSNPRHKHYLISYLLIITAYLLILSFKKFFMTDRFCVMAVLIFMLALPFCIEKIWKQNTGKPVWRRTVVIILLLIPALDSFINSDSDKAYIASATNWVEKHRSENTRILTNHKQIAVFGGGCLSGCYFNDTYSPLKAKDITNHNLLAIQAKHKESEQLEVIDALTASPDWTLTEVFSNKKDDKVFILTKQPQSIRLSE